MIPQEIDYYRASSVSDALQMLNDNPDAKLLAGGHSLVPAMKLRLNSPSMVVDISGLADLQHITETNGSLHIGAMATHAMIASSALVHSKVPILAETAHQIGDVQVRNMGTIGGSLAHADPAADWPAALIACQAQISIQSAQSSRKVAAADFFTGFFSTALEEGEMVTAIEVPIPDAGTGMTYQKFSQPASRFAIVGCAALVKVVNGNFTSVSVAFNGVGDAAYKATALEAALVGKPATLASIEAAAAHATDEAESILSDSFASESYRAHLAKVFAKRALLAAAGL